jgi:hypothetical protein
MISKVKLLFWQLKMKLPSFRWFLPLSTKIIAIGIAAAVVIGLGVGSGALVAWALTSIWPSLPFWPVAILSMVALWALSNKRS